MKIGTKKLQEIIESHGKWLKFEDGGKCADLRGAYLRGAHLPNGIYQIVGCGSYNRCTTYDSINDRVICGCWEDGGGNHLESFKKRIETIYGDKGEAPNAAYYIEYMAAINFFEMVKREIKEPAVESLPLLWLF